GQTPAQVPAGTIWYLTIAGAPDPLADGGSGILLSTDGTNWSSALVLTFDTTAAAGSATDWNRTVTIHVKASSGAVVKGDQTIEIMSSVYSTTPISTGIAGFADVAISDVDVHVIDGDLPGLIAGVPPTGLNVVEGSSSVVGSYTLALTTAPAPGETVTVMISSADPRLLFTTSLSTAATTGELQFTLSNWNVAQTVTITAVDDGAVEGEKIDTITATVTSSEPSGGVYSNGVVDNPTEQINVYDGDSGGVLVLPSTGTLVVGPGHPGSYTIQLTRAPATGDSVTVTILSDGKTLVSSAD
ncbi:MAG: hypothetical protein ACRDL8_09150, partial [Solirubrobacteraceae bacterium]